MSVDTTKRFDRIIAILIQLQASKKITAKVLAERFQVSLRTIYRDIRTLESCGVPVVGEAGLGYSIMEGYRLPPIMFTKEEAISFLAAQKLMQKFTDKSLGEHYATAMLKIKAILRGKEKDWLAILDTQVIITSVKPLFHEGSPDALEVLFESIAEGKQVFMKYRSLRTDIPTERMIEPVGIYHENNNWYVLGFCHSRLDYRQFRTDRMLLVKRSQKRFSRTHGSLKAYRNQQHLRHTTRVRILVDRKIAPHIAEGKFRYGFESEKSKGNYVEMTFQSPDIENAFPRWYMMFGDYAEILEPAQLRHRVLELSRNIHDKLSQ